MTNTKKRNGFKIALVIALVAAIAVIFAGVYFFFGPQATEGAKEIVIEVIDNNEESTKYVVHTDAKYLRGAMEEAEGLTFSEANGMILTINGISADFIADGAYWAFYMNDGYCNFGINEQPVTDGDYCRIVYTLSE